MPRIPLPRISLPRIPRWVAIIAAAGLVLMLAVVALVVVRVIQMNQPPTQPIAFSHAVHAGALKFECVFCHRTASTGQAARVPSVEQCMFCHSVVKGSPEIEKVRSAWERQEPINWVRVYRLPDLAHFFHFPHIQSGFDCATCHGNVAEMAQVRQVRKLNMGDCVGCHRANNAVTECGKCHF